MKKIVIDARELRTSSGRYVERLLHHLQEVDTDLSHRYVVLLKPADFDGWSPKSKRFEKVACKYKEFTFGEQLGFAWQLYKLRANLVHFPFVQQPVLYQKAVVTTVQYFDPLDVDDMTKAINKVLTDEKLRKELIAKGKKQVTKFSWKRMAEQTLAIYKDALHEK